MANDDDFISEYIKDILYGKGAKYKEQKVKYKFDPHEFAANKSWEGSFNFNRILIKGECVNCQHYICPKEDKVVDGPDDVVVYSCVLCPGCIKGHSVLSKEKTRPCVDFERFPNYGRYS